MKKYCLTAMITVFLLLCTNGIQAQTSQTKLNQVELSKQLTGNWKWDVAKDTTAYYEGKSYGTGIGGNFKYVTKGKTIFEGQRFYGYDERINKYIGVSIEEQDITIYAMWFTSNNKFIVINYDDISNPEKATWKVEGEIKSPDMFIQTIVKDGKPVLTETMIRIK
jgi:hypothetical protein